MPKETIYGDGLPYGEDDPGRSVVEVGWARDAEHVELASKCIHVADGSDYSPPLEPIEEPPPMMYATGEPVAFVGEMLEFEAVGHTGHYVQLDRKGINQLIRVLRRARDQAFGRDE